MLAAAKADPAGFLATLSASGEPVILDEIQHAPELLPTIKVGGLLENFVALELIKDAGWSETGPSFYHWHTAKREEVDILMESRDGRLVGAEVKASSSVSSSDFRGLRALQELVCPPRPTGDGGQSGDGGRADPTRFGGSAPGATRASSRHGRHLGPGWR